VTRLTLLVAVTAMACTSFDPGAEVTIVATIEGLPASGAVETTTGAVATIEDAWVAVGSVELHPCGSALSRLWRVVRPVRVAHAHSLTSRTRLGTPVAVDRTTANRAPLGSLEPFPGEYCNITLLLEAADEDANAPSHLVGYSMVVSGMVQDQAFALRATSTMRRVFTLDPPLIIDGDNRVATLEFGMDLGQWLAELDLVGMPSDVARRALTAAAEYRISLSVDR